MSLPPRFRSDLWRRLAAAQDTYQDRTPPLPGESLQDLARAVGRLVSARGISRPPRAWFPKLTVGAVVTAAVAATVVMISHRRISSDVGVAAGSASVAPSESPPLVSGGEQADGQPFVADARSDLPLQFSDGSTVTFRAGSAGRMQRLTGSGAEIVLEHGRLDAHVIHADRTLWLIHAGPYRVRVTGTRFAMVWSGPAFQVELYEGAVIVDGSVLGAGVPLRAGHRLRIASGTVLVEPLTTTTTSPERPPGPVAVAPGALPPSNVPNGARAMAAQVVRSPPATGPSGLLAADLATRGSDLPPGDLPVSLAGDGPPEAAPGIDRHRRGAGRVVTGRAGEGAPTDLGKSSRQDAQWLVLAERGAYRESLQAANRLGWKDLCRRLDARRLLTLGDVARYSGAHAKARQAFQALVTRFPNDRLAADAVFSLGRLAFESRRPAEATRWFRRYVADWPEAPLANQATGRLLECAIRTDDRQAARGVATRYLSRAPNGPHASLAREVLEQPVDGTP